MIGSKHSVLAAPGNNLNRLSSQNIIPRTRRQNAGRNKPLTLPKISSVANLGGRNNLLENHGKGLRAMQNSTNRKSHAVLSPFEDYPGGVNKQNQRTGAGGSMIRMSQANHAQRVDLQTGRAPGSNAVEPLGQDRMPAANMGGSGVRNLSLTAR